MGPSHALRRRIPHRMKTASGRPTSTSVRTRLRPGPLTATRGSVPTPSRQNAASALRAQGVTRRACPSSAGSAPPDLQAAYGTPSATNGAGRTVAIVDAYDDPNAESDLAFYRSATGLPRVHHRERLLQEGRPERRHRSYPPSNAGWAEEISLDLDMVSAMCPLCNILLVEANSNSFANLGTAVNRAATMGAIAISNSYGGNEFSTETASDSTYFNHPGIAITASTGDNGYGVEYPAASQERRRGGRHQSQEVGRRVHRDRVERRREWVQRLRDEADVATRRRRAPAEPSPTSRRSPTRALASGSTTPTAATPAGRSSAAPARRRRSCASVYALGYSGPSANQPASYPYANPGSLHDVVGGSNGNCGGSYLCTAVAGYDGPTGLGSPNGVVAFAATSDFSISAAPSRSAPPRARQTTSTISTAITTGGAADSRAVFERRTRRRDGIVQPAFGRGGWIIDAEL